MVNKICNGWAGAVGQRELISATTTAGFRPEISDTSSGNMAAGLAARGNSR